MPGTNADGTATEGEQSAPLEIATAAPLYSGASWLSYLMTASRGLSEAAASRESQIAERARHLGNEISRSNVRIAVAGSPGCGKSTLVQALKVGPAALAENVEPICIDSTDLDQLTDSAGKPNFDAFVLVLSVADLQFPHDKVGLAPLIRGHRWPRFVVLNMIDHAAATDFAVLRRRVMRALATTTGEFDRPWLLAADPALAACLSGRTPGIETGEFPDFRAELARLRTYTLPQAQMAARVKELTQLSGQLRDLIDVETTILAGDRITMHQSTARLSALVAAAMQEVTETQALYAEDLGVLARRLVTNLAGMGRESPKRCVSQLRFTTDTGSYRALRDQLPVRVDDAIRSEFDDFTRLEGAFAQETWRQVIEGFRRRTEECINGLRSHANHLIGTNLPPVTLAVSDTDYALVLPLFHHSGRINVTQLGRLQSPKLWPLAPALARNRVFGRLLDVVSAQVELETALAMQAVEYRIGNRYWDVSSSLVSHLGDTVRLLLHGISRAEDLRRVDADVRTREIQMDRAARSTATLIAERCVQLE
jgi:hypothetical protein